MHQLKRIFLSLVVVSPTTLLLSAITVSSVHAQAANQTLAQCVKELNDAYPYRADSAIHKRHTQSCLNYLATQRPMESLGQCVAGLNQVYPYRADSEITIAHTETCSNLLKAQSSNFNPRVRPNSNGGRNNVPGSGRYQPSPQEFANCVNGQIYKQKEVCIDPWGGVDETCFYRGRGGRRTITEPTGVSIEQARSICGG